MRPSFIPFTLRNKIELIIREELQKKEKENVEFSIFIQEFTENLTDRINELISDEIYFNRRYYQ